jgi:exopolyphosphatase/guanosine-5'-triphosphate,3'-diphosphate pyrophosphatase
VRLTERFLHADPVIPAEAAQMREAIDRELSRLTDKEMAPAAGLTLVGIAGTFTTLAAMEKKLARYAHGEVHGSVLTLLQVRRQLDRLERRSIAERRRMIGLEPQRADVIFAGASLMERIMTRYQAERVLVSDQGVRYGLLHEAARPN